ncbi:PilW family protein [Rossellomorea marisflavi]|uniref:PilW family protein n=1 Tax=Rossellomorea marisflavi TaxID=189381 RepID=UPI00345775C2
MKKYIFNQRGVTLIELLAAAVVLAIVMVLIANVQIFGQKQFHNQTEQVSHEAEVRLAMNIVTKEIRSSHPDNIKLSKDHDTIITDSGTITRTGSNLTLDNRTIAEHIGTFEVCEPDYLGGEQSDSCKKEEVANPDSVKITIGSEENKNGKSSSLSTTLYIRK